MTTSDLIQRLREQSRGFEEWRVESPIDGAFCMSFTRDDSLRPEQDARGWLSEHLLRHPDSQFKDYLVKRHTVQTAKDKAMTEAAAELERLRHWQQIANDRSVEIYRLNDELERLRTESELRRMALLDEMQAAERLRAQVAEQAGSQQ